MDVLSLDLSRPPSVPAASRDREPVRRRRDRLIAIVTGVRRLASGGAGGGAVAKRRDALLAVTASTIVLGIGLLAITSLTSAPWATIDPGIGADTALAGPTGGVLLWLLFGLIGSLRVLRLPGGATM